MTAKTSNSSPSNSQTRHSWLSGWLVTAVLAVALGFILAASGEPGRDNRAPDVPTTSLQPQGPNKVSLHVYAVGVQIYMATPSATTPGAFNWTLRAPEAILFDSEGNQVGIHYAGPTWETESGSVVVGSRIVGVTVDPTAIPWLLLGAVSSEGPGVLEGTTYIQRVNTSGGLAPATPPTQAGQETRVPYTAEYYFYRESTH